jgi:hypothetical protein
MSIQSLEQCWNDYMAAFAAADEDTRLRLLDKSVADDVIFTNPGGEGSSRRGLSTHIAAFRQGNPDAFFTTDKVYPQADKLLAIWSMHKQDGTKVATGYNFVTPGPDGRLRYMAGFF